MANSDIPNGFTPVGTMNGSPWCGTVRAFQADNTSDIFPGDLLELGADGKVVAATATGTNCIGVMVGRLPSQSANTTTGVMDQQLDNGTISLERSWYDASADVTGWILVTVGPDVLYEVQCTGTIAITEIGTNADLIATTGSTIKGRSQQELSATVSSVAAQLRIVGLAQRIDNDVTAANAKWVVRINENHYTKLAGV